MIPSLAQVYGGPTRAVLDMVNAQNAAGLQSDIATTHKTIPNNEEFYGRLYSFPSFLGEYKYSAQLQNWLHNNAKHYDLIHIHSIFCHSTLIASRAAERFQIPYILFAHGQCYKWALENRSLFLKIIYFKIFENKTIKRAKAIHLTTMHELNHWSAPQLTSAHYVLPLGVESSPKLPSETIKKLYPELHSKKIILFLSRIHPKKGLHLLLSWMPAVLNKFDEWIFVIAGDGDAGYLHHLKKIIKKNCLEKKVFFAGNVEKERKWVLLQRANLFVLASQTENFSIAAAEAMAAGLPVLLSDQVGISVDAVEAQCGLMFSLQKESFSLAAGTLMNDENLRFKMSLNAVKLAQNRFDWKKITLAQIRIYEEIIAGTFKGSW